jgi:hypothetical protein
LDRALYGYRLARNMMVGFGLLSIVALAFGTDGHLWTTLTVFCGFAFYRVGQTSTLLEIKGLRRSDCPVLQRWFGFYSWYQTAPDHRKDDSEPEFAKPPGPFGDAP